MIDCEPTKAHINVWESMEINGNVFVWYHSEDAKPDWFPEPIEEINNKRWVFEGRTEHHVNCHFQVLNVILRLFIEHQFAGDL